MIAEQLTFGTLFPLESSSLSLEQVRVIETSAKRESARPSSATNQERVELISSRARAGAETIVVAWDPAFGAGSAREGRAVFDDQIPGSTTDDK